jgi:hypothetical protein
VLNNPIVNIDPDGREVVGTDGKPVAYFQNPRDGAIIFTSNASDVVKKMVTAMFTTTCGKESAIDMMTDSRKIHLVEEADEPYLARDSETGKSEYLYGNTTVSKDGSEVLIEIFTGTFLAEKEGQLDGKDGAYKDLSQTQFYNRVMIHEKGHMDGDAAAEEKIKKCTNCTDQQKREIIEYVPESREQDNLDTP